MTLESAPAFIAAGAIGVGMGSWLMGDFGTDGIRTRSRQIVDAIAEARAERAARPGAAAR